MRRLGVFFVICFGTSCAGQIVPQVDELPYSVSSPAQPPAVLKRESPDLLQILGQPSRYWSGRKIHSDGSATDLPLPRLSEAAGLARAEIRKMLEVYAPRLWFHPEERYGPMDTAKFIAESSLWLHRPGGNDRELATPGGIDAQDLSTNLDGVYLSWEGEPSRDLSPIFWRLSNHPAVLGSQALARVAAPKPGRKRFLIEYWYHLPFSAAGVGGMGDHQGDWEGLAVLVEAGWEENARLVHRPLAVYTAAHDGGQWHCASEISWVPGTDEGQGRAPAGSAAWALHPEAFSALGSHATYAREGKVWRVLGSDRTARGYSWDSWRDLRPLVLEPYYGFRGTWGAVSWFSFMSGPLLPSEELKRFPKGSLGKETTVLEKLFSRCIR